MELQNPHYHSAEVRTGGTHTGSRLGKLIKSLGPGLITGASDDDPSGIGTYAAAGASFGYRFLWMAWVTFPMMCVAQFMCAKVAMISGRGLTRLLKLKFGKTLTYATVAALFFANSLNAGADIGAVAAGIHLMVPALNAKYLIVPVAVLIFLTQCFCSYELIARIFKWLTLTLFAYVFSSFLARPNGLEVLYATLVPSLDFHPAYISMLIAILGTTISPYLFFWQTNQEIEEEIAEGKVTLQQRKGATPRELNTRKTDVIAGMTLSNAVMYFIILASAATLFKAGVTEIQSAEDAAVALRPLAGPAAEFLMAVGLIGSGVLAIPVLTTSSAYAISEAFGWNCGLCKKPHEAKAFYLAIAASTAIGLIVNYVGISMIAALVWSSVVNGILAGPLLILILLICNSKDIMGSEVNTRWVNVGGIVTALTMLAAAVLYFALPKQ